MSNFGLWRAVSVLLNIDGKTTAYFPNKTGRLIYEEFDPNTGESSGESKFYELKSGLVKNLDEGLEILVNLSDKESSEELTE